jgi:hypothetical protein
VKRSAKERKAAKDEFNDTLRALRIELAEAQTTLSELRAVLASERGKVLDLPNPSHPRMQQLANLTGTRHKPRASHEFQRLLAVLMKADPALLARMVKNFRDWVLDELGRHL